MCGRYTAAKDFTELIKLVGVIMSRVPIFGPRYNIAPTQLAANAASRTMPMSPQKTAFAVTPAPPTDDDSRYLPKS
jgi:putative SOS response-associated peptidase YedK